MRIFDFNLSRAFGLLSRDQTVEKLKELMTIQLHIVNVLTDFLTNWAYYFDIKNEQSIVLWTICGLSQENMLCSTMVGPIKLNLVYNELEI